MILDKYKKWFCFLLPAFLSFTASAQSITFKNGKYGLINAQTGDVDLEQNYDSIYAIPFDKHITNGSKAEERSPIYACIVNKVIQLYNSNSNTFHPTTFDEIRLVEEISERISPYPKKYKPNHVDCVLLRKGKYWGYIGHKKMYGFHDKLEKTDVFTIFDPKWLYLKFVEEDNSYESQKYLRTKRIMAASQDSLYGAIKFETGEIVVPYKYRIPIEKYGNRFDKRGMEFFSTEGGFISYFIARENHDSPNQIIINAKGFDVSFDIDNKLTFDLFSEYGQQYLYLKSTDLPKHMLHIWDYNLGKLLLFHQCDSTYRITDTKRSEFILSIAEYSETYNRYRITWYNVISTQVILFHEDKYKFGFRNFFVPIEQNGEQVIYFQKPKNIIGKIAGKGVDLHVEWVKKVYMKGEGKK